jgi:class 3 adenylate cyclase
MNQLIGVNVLRYYATGIYHRPTAEERVFLFINLVGSTQLAEQLGSATYFGLLRHFVDDLTEPVLATEGKAWRATPSSTTSASSPPAIYSIAGRCHLTPRPPGAATPPSAAIACPSGRSA